MPLIVTPGAADANSYATVEEADAYMLGRLYATTWADLDEEVKEAALIQAARQLDGLFVWTGVATDPAVQALTWPRTGMFNRNGYPIAVDAIPAELKNAQIEFARQLGLSDITADDDVYNKGITSLSAGSVSLSFGPKDHTRDFLGVWPDVTAERGIPDLVRVLLVPSWYVRAETAVPVLFDAVDVP